MSKGKQVAEKNLHPRCASGSIFSATLAHTVATHHACAPTHSACGGRSSMISCHNPKTDTQQGILSNRSVWCSAWRGYLFCCTHSLNPHPWLLLPPLTPISNSLRSYIFYKGAIATHCFCSPAGRSGYAGCHTFCRCTAPPLLQCSFHSLRLLPTFILRDNNILRSVPFTPHRCIMARA